jgi:hypothetical protein
LNHQPEAQHPKSPAIHKLAGRLPHLPNFSTAASDVTGQSRPFCAAEKQRTFSPITRSPLR